MVRVLSNGCSKANTFARRVSFHKYYLWAIYFNATPETNGRVELRRNMRQWQHRIQIEIQENKQYCRDSN